MGIYRLIYRSRATEPIDQNLVRSIEKVSVQNNERLGISGLLIATERQFFQVLEGPIEAINQLYCTIAKDPRHTDLILISYGLVPNREFSDWKMKGIGLGLLSRFLVENLKKKYGVREDGDLRLPEDEYMTFAFLYDILSFLRSD